MIVFASLEDTLDTSTKLHQTFCKTLNCQFTAYTLHSHRLMISPSAKATFHHFQLNSDMYFVAFAGLSRQATIVFLNGLFPLNAFHKSVRFQFFTRVLKKLVLVRAIFPRLAASVALLQYLAVAIACSRDNGAAVPYCTFEI